MLLCMSTVLIRSLRLQPVVPESGTSVAQSQPLSEEPANPLLGVTDPASRLQRPLSVEGRNDHQAVSVAKDNVTGVDTVISYDYGHADCGHGHPVLTRPHEASSGVDRVTHLAGPGCVPADSIDHGAGQAVSNGHRGHEIPPDRGIEPTTVVDYHDRTGRHIVDEVADSLPFARLHGNITDGKRPAAEATIWVERADPHRLTGDAKSIECV